MTLTREKLTAPHYLAYSFAVKHLMLRTKFGASILDFGARQSALPMALANFGFVVSVTDRDKTSRTWQEREFAQHGKECKWVDDLPLDASLDAITAMWVLQHNEPDVIHERSRAIWESLKPGGMFLYAGSWTPSAAFKQTNRQDPQWVLGRDELESLVIGPFVGAAGLLGSLADRKWFRYTHATADGDWCEPEQANAVAMCLLKYGEK